MLDSFSTITTINYIYDTHLRHLQRDYLGIVTFCNRNVSVVTAKYACAFGVSTVGDNSVVPKLGLFFCKSDTSDVATIVFGGKRGESSPSAADVKEPVGWL